MRRSKGVDARQQFHSAMKLPPILQRKRSPLEEWAYGDQPRPYTKLPRNHPDYDAEDAPPLRGLFAEIVGGLTLAVIVGVVAIAAQPLGPVLPRFLAWLSGLL